jgi:hypothetical protein
VKLSDRFKAALEAVVQRITNKYDYAVPYACRVVAQNGDGTLELVPEDGRLGSNQTIPGLSSVPIRYGAPGMTATVQAQARVIVEFENADPARPVVTAWDPMSPLIMLTLGGGNQPLFRVGDMVQCGGPGQPVTITLTAPAAGTPAGLPPGSFVQGFISFGITPPDPTGLTAEPLYGVGVTGATNAQS